MKRILLTGAIVALLTGCAVMNGPAGAGLYVNVTDGVTATGNPLGSKCGKASAKAILGLVASGDASIQTAARSAGITRISHVDKQVKDVLGVYTTFTTIVYGD